MDESEVGMDVDFKAKYQFSLGLGSDIVEIKKQMIAKLNEIPGLTVDIESLRIQ